MIAWLLLSLGLAALLMMSYLAGSEGPGDQSRILNTGGLADRDRFHLLTRWGDRN